MTRQFEANPAVRGSVPLWVGLYGPSGGGKTYSALRLGTGIVSVTGGEIYVVDTEANRARSYSDYFRFKHMDFGQPFASTDYLAAVKHCCAQGANVVIIDSLSPEHDGPGGYLSTQEAEVARLSQGDEAKRERVKMLAWSKPSAMRQAMVNGLLQLNVNIIATFRAKEKTRPGKDANGKTVMVEQGWMPIAGPTLLYEMTVSCLLLPAAGGVPSWRSEYDGERSMMKQPRQFQDLFAKQHPLSEEIGAGLARWARGEPSTAPATLGGEFSAQDTQLAEAAANGLGALQKAWGSIGPQAQAALKARLDTKHKPTAEKMDAAR